VAHLRKMMLDELMRHDYTQSTAEAYIHALEEFATYFHRSPDKLEVSQFQPDLLKQRKPACFERHRIRASGPVRSTSLFLCCRLTAQLPGQAPDQM